MIGRPRSRGPAIVALGIATAGLAVGVVVLLIGGDDDRRGDATGPVRIREPAPTTNRNDLQIDRIDLPEANAALTNDDPSTAPTTTVTREAIPADLLAVAERASSGGVRIAITPSAPAPVKPAPNIGQDDAHLPREIIQRFIRRSMVPIRDCYEGALITQPELEGTVHVAFEIGTDGRVTSATGTGLDDTVASCVADVIRAIQFPQPDGRGAVRVRYPFVFRPPS